MERDTVGLQWNKKSSQEPVRLQADDAGWGSAKGAREGEGSRGRHCSNSVETQKSDPEMPNGTW